MLQVTTNQTSNFNLDLNLDNPQSTCYPTSLNKVVTNQKDCYKIFSTFSSLVAKCCMDFGACCIAQKTTIFNPDLNKDVNVVYYQIYQSFNADDIAEGYYDSFDDKILDYVNICLLNLYQSLDLTNFDKLQIIEFKVKDVIRYQNASHFGLKLDTNIYNHSCFYNITNQDDF